MTDGFDLGGRVVVVTGASSGLGVELARGLAKAGAALVLAARRAERLEVLAGELAAEGASVSICPCDVADSTQVEQALLNLSSTDPDQSRIRAR